MTGHDSLSARCCQAKLSGEGGGRALPCTTVQRRRALPVARRSAGRLEVGKRLAKGHAGDVMNERADGLARKGLEEARRR